MFTHFLNFNVNILYARAISIFRTKVIAYIANTIQEIVKKARFRCIPKGILHKVGEGDSEDRLTHRRMKVSRNFGRNSFEWWPPVPVPWRSTVFEWHLEHSPKLIGLEIDWQVRGVCTWLPGELLISATSREECVQIRTFLQVAHHRDFIHAGDKRADDFHFTGVFSGHYLSLSFCLPPPGFNTRRCRSHICEGYPRIGRDKRQKMVIQQPILENGEVDEGVRWIRKDG